jgi:type VI secretion system protein ImpH
MADTSRAANGPLGRASATALEELLGRATRAPHEFGFLQLLRRVQHLAAELPRLGEADRPASEPLRLAQDASLSFPPTEIARLEAGVDGRPMRLLVNFFGMLGPNGPLPLHLTEYARDRLRNAGDPTLSRFLDVFHHRMLLYMFRAWAAGQPAVSRDRPTDDRFEVYVSALEGLGLSSLRGRDAFPDEARLFYAGRFSAQPRNADGLADIVGDFLGVPARVEPFMRDWLELPAPDLWRLGRPGGPGRLGRTSIVGTRVASWQSKFRLVLGPLPKSLFERLLPGGASLRKLAALVRGYVGEEQGWDVRLVLQEEVEQPWQLGRAPLGWTSWLGRIGAPGERRSHSDVILDPQREPQRDAA